MTNILELTTFVDMRFESCSMTHAGNRKRSYYKFFVVILNSVQECEIFKELRIFSLFYEPFPKLPITPFCVSVGAWSGKITLNFSQKSSFEIFLISSNGNASSLLYLV